MRLAIDTKYLLDCQKRLFDAVYAWLGYTGKRKSEEDIKGWNISHDQESFTFFIGYNGVDAEVTLSLDTIETAVKKYEENSYYYLEKTEDATNKND